MTALNEVYPFSRGSFNSTGKIMKTGAVFFILLTACIHAEPVVYYQVPGWHVEKWSPDTNQVKKALVAVEQYCRTEMSDAIRAMRRAHADCEVEVIESNGVFTVHYDPPQVTTNAIPLNFCVYGVPYVKFEKQIGAFLEDRGTHKARLIAIQHWLSKEIRQTVPESRPFTVYYLEDTGEVGLNTDLGYKQNTNTNFMRVYYSPGPPYFISDAQF